MHFDSTLPPQPISRPISAEEQPQLGGLVILWSREEPNRVGEVLLFQRIPGTNAVIGRGGQSAEAQAAGFVRQRPGQNVATGPLLSRSLSRKQLRLEVLADHRVALENIGSCPLLWQGRPTQSVVLEEGAVLELQNELVLLFTARPAELSPLASGVPLPEFGCVDDIGMVGESPALWSIRAKVAAIGPLNTHVLVLGQSGTGKELVAKGLHERSGRARKALVARNAATIPEGLIDAELFGNIAHYPNHGMPERPGLIGAANDSTLFLDEFGEMPVHVQSHLLRVLDQGEYQRLGEARTRTVNFRLVAATNRQEHELKHDVRARLMTRIRLPGLNERREDIPLLVRHLLEQQLEAPKAGRSRGGVGQEIRMEITPELIVSLVTHHYTTNVRELNELLLESLLERQGTVLGVPSRLRVRTPPQDIPPGNRGQERVQLGARASAIPVQASPFSPEERTRLQVMRRYDFRIGDLIKSGEYPANRQTADLHLRQLMSRAFVSSQGQLERVVELLASGLSDPTKARLQARISTWIEHLTHRLEAPEYEGEVGFERLQKELIAEYRGFREIGEVLRLVGGRA